MTALYVSWGAVALLLIGVRVGHRFGYQDALEETKTARRRELREVARWLDPDLVRRRRQRVALAFSVLILATAAALLLR